jgi:hypothetical protein
MVFTERLPGVYLDIYRGRTYYDCRGGEAPKARGSDELEGESGWTLGRTVRFI